MALVWKVTIVPVCGLAEWNAEPFDKSLLPFEIAQGVQLADVQSLMAGADIDYWERSGFLSKRDVQAIKQWRYALVHTFQAEEGQSYPEKESEELIHRIFWGLRIVRPSRTPYEYLQARLFSGNKIDPFSYSHRERELLFVPDSETLNEIRTRDALELHSITPTLLRVYETNCKFVMRAIRNLEVGYISIFADVQQLLWVTGLDSLFTSHKWKHNGMWVATERIKKFLGPDYRIYKDGDLPPYIATPTQTVADVARDVYRLRNFFAHGEWPGQEWTKERFRNGVGAEPIAYAEMLREATSVLLRASLVKILKEDLLDLFGNKQKMNTYFTRFGLVRKSKQRRGWLVRLKNLWRRMLQRFLP